MPLLLPLAALAADNPECSFAAPTGLLKPQAYRAYAFTPAPGNQAVESADIAKDVRLEIRHSQCVDFLVTKYTFKVKSNLIAAGAQSASRDFAIKALTDLKLRDAAFAPTDLLSFLKKTKASSGIISACKDGSNAPPGECSWDSLGGYIFEVKPQKESTTISLTEYISG